MLPEALDRFSLEGKVAIVTGASSGLGAAAVRALAGAGAKVAAVARRAERLDGLARETGALAVPADVTDDGQIAALVAETEAALGPPTVLVNAAGHFASRDRAEDEKPDAIRATLGLNLVAPFLLAQQVFPHMAAAKSGSVIHVSSVSGHVGIPGIPQASYAASKLGLSGLTRELAVQWARHGIRVNTIAPGFFRSELTGPMYDDERSLAWLRRGTPLPFEGTPEDFTGALVWLAGDAGRYVTGQTIVIDGGWTAR